MQPTTLPGRSFVAVGTDRISRLLFHWRARDFSLNPVTGQTPTFTRATAGGAVRGRNGLLRTPVHSQPRFDMYDASSGSGLTLDTPGLLFEPQVTQICPNPQAPDSWTTTGTPVITTGQVDPWGGSTALLIEDDDGAANEGKVQAVTYTGDGTKAATFAVRAGSAAAITVGIFDATAVANRVIASVTWNGGTTAPTIAITSGTGVVFTPVPVYDRNGVLWWLVSVSADGVVAANTNQLQVFAGTTAAGTGTFYFAGANTWNAIYPTSWVNAAATVRNADLLTNAVNFGQLNADNDDITIYAKLARPQHADCVGTMGFFPQICEISSAVARLRLYFDSAVRRITAQIDTAGTDAFAVQPIPSTPRIEVCAQFRDLAVGGTSIVDVGAGFGNVSATATAIAAFGDGTLTAGDGSLEALGTGLMDLKVARGQFTLQQMREAF